MSNRFDVDWPHGHVTRDWLKAEIIDRKIQVFAGSFTTVDGYAVKVTQKCGGHLLYGITKEGIASPGSRFDVYNAPAPKRRVEGVIVLYKTLEGVIDGCFTKDSSDFIGDHIVARVPFTWEEP